MLISDCRNQWMYVNFVEIFWFQRLLTDLGFVAFLRIFRKFCVRLLGVIYEC